MSRRLGHVGVVALYSLLLLLALRFCGRTYPGWYFPRSRFLNGLLNDNVLFTGVGYGFVIIAAAAAAARIFMPFQASEPTRLRRRLRVVQGAAIALVIVIICYGVWWAVIMHRLPWQRDGDSSDYMLGLRSKSGIQLAHGEIEKPFSRE